MENGLTIVTFIVIVFFVILAFLTLLIPFFIYRIRNESIKLNANLTKILNELKALRQELKQEMKNTDTVR